MVKPRQLKLLAILKQKITVDLPFYFNFVLHHVARWIKKENEPHKIINHHGLIKLIIIHGLAQQELNWDNLVNSTLAPPIENPAIE